MAKLTRDPAPVTLLRNGRLELRQIRHQRFELSTDPRPRDVGTYSIPIRYQPFAPFFILIACPISMYGIKQYSKGKFLHQMLTG